MCRPPTPGGRATQQNLTPAAAGRCKHRGSQGRGNWGRGVNMLLAQKSRASGSKSAQAARLLCCAQKVLARFTDLQALCGEGRCLGTPLPSPGRHAQPSSYSLPALPLPFPLTGRPGPSGQTYPKNPPHKPTPNFLVTLGSSGAPGEVLSLP